MDFGALSEFVSGLADFPVLLTTTLTSHYQSKYRLSWRNAVIKAKSKLQGVEYKLSDYAASIRLDEWLTIFPLSIIALLYPKYVFFIFSHMSTVACKTFDWFAPGFGLGVFVFDLHCARHPDYEITTRTPILLHLSDRWWSFSSSDCNSRITCSRSVSKLWHH